MYLLTLETQTRLFLFSLGFGFLLGVLYDIFRTVRLILTDWRKAVFIQDTLYFVLSAFLAFLYLLVVNQGRVRGYIIVGMLIGFFIYYFTFGVVAIALTSQAVRLVRRGVELVARAIVTPLYFIITTLKKIGAKITGIIKKNSKKFQNKAKSHLKIGRKLVYNQKVNNREKASKSKKVCKCRSKRKSKSGIKSK